MYNLLRSIYHRFRFYLKINWYKTLYFNFKVFPFSIAKKLPVYIYEWVKFSDLSGEIVIDAPIKRGMIGIGKRYEMTSRKLKTAEINVKGKLKFKGYAQFGKDIFIYVKENAILEFGDMTGVASQGKIICTHYIMFNTYARVGSECQIIDTDFHQMINTDTGEMYPISQPIKIGSYNYVGRWSSIMKGTITPNYCTIASNTLCNKDYTSYGNNVLIGGIPAKLLKENISRDWEGERESLEKSLIAKF